jgi:hypothetical protein
MQIYDNALPDDVFYRLQSAIMSPDFPWYWGGTAYMNRTELSLFSNTFAHNSYYNGKSLSDIGQLVEEAAFVLVNSIGQRIKTLDRVRIALTTAVPEPLQHPAHIDMTMPHYTGLLYLNDADGDTFIYNEKYDLEKGNDTYLQYLGVKDNLTLMDRITPKANRFIHFDGLHWHNSSAPTTVARRLIVNFNYNI